MGNLARRGRLSVTLVATATFVSWYVQRSSTHVGLTFMDTFTAAVGALALAMVIDDVRPMRRARSWARGLA